jgi:MFS transporter, DHA2 family, multidrug resistance protein
MAGTTDSTGYSPAGPARSGVVLATLIVVAGVANLNLAVANVALPDIGKALDASQTGLNLVSIGFSLGLAMSVLYLGALGDRHGRKQMLILGMVLSIPASLVAGLAGSVGVLFIGRLLGGIAAGMAYPTTLALITALWADDPQRTQAIALWAGLGGAIMALGPLVAGALLEHVSWSWVFLVTLPLAVAGLLMALRFVPSHVGETTEPVDNLGGVLSVALVGALVLAINFASVPGAGAAAIALGALAVAAGTAFVLRQRRATSPIYDLRVARRSVFWVAAIAGMIVFGTLMATMYIGQQFIQNILGYSTLDAGAAILPAALMMVLAAAPSEKLVTNRGSRVTLLLGFASCALGFLVMLLLWGEGSPYWQVGLAYALVGLGVGLAMTPASRCLTGAVPRRSDHDLDHGRRANRGLRRGDRRPGGGVAAAGAGHQPDRKRSAEVLLQRRGTRLAIPALPAADHRRGEDVVPRRRELGLHDRNSRSGPGNAARRPRVPRARARARADGRLRRRGRDGDTGYGTGPSV